MRKKISGGENFDKEKEWNKLNELYQSDLKTLAVLGAPIRSFMILNGIGNFLTSTSDYTVKKDLINKWIKRTEEPYKEPAISIIDDDVMAFIKGKLNENDSKEVYNKLIERLKILVKDAPLSSVQTVQANGELFNQPEIKKRIKEVPELSILYDERAETKLREKIISDQLDMEKREPPNINDFKEALKNARDAENAYYEAKGIGAYGGKTSVKYNGRNYKVHTGLRGGKYILVGKDKKKVYI